MAKEPSSPRGSGSGNAAEGNGREPLPRLTEVVPNYEELSPFYQRPNSAPAAGADITRPHFPATRQLERHHSDFPAAGAQFSEAPLPPLQAKGATVRTFPGAGRLSSQSPFELALEQRSVELIERSQSDRPTIVRRQTASEIAIRSPTLPERSERQERRHESKRSSIYDPIHEAEEPPERHERRVRRVRRDDRGQLPPIEVRSAAEPLREGPPVPQPHQPPLPPLPRTAHPHGATGYPLATSRYTPYPSERPPYEPHSRRRYSQTLPRPPSPSQYNLRSPTLGGRPPASYTQDPYSTYPPPSYTRGSRRTSIPSYSEERRHSRQESLRYPPQIPYGSSYPQPVPYEYGGRGYYEPYQGYLEYSPGRRLSQQEPGEQVTHLGVPERVYRPPVVVTPTSPSSIRVQVPPHSGISTTTSGKRRGNLPKESKEKLKQWLNDHVDHPYPTEEQKKELAAEAGMTMGQINNWFINARRRTLPKIPGRLGSPSTSRTLRRRPGDS